MMSQATSEPQERQPQISVRPTREIYELLVEEAARERRSLNQQVTEILYQHFYGAPST